MKPSEQRTPEELQAWVAAIIEREQRNQIFGTVCVHLENGRITRVTTSRNEMPANAPGK